MTILRDFLDGGRSTGISQDDISDIFDAAEEFIFF
jgi:hypothetical protein